MNQSKRGKASPKTSRPGIAKRSPNNNNRGKQPRVARAMRQPILARAMGGSVYRNNAQVGVAAAYATGQSTKSPKITQSSMDSSRIIHRELVGSVFGSVAFTTALTFSVNPGLPTSFPWLSTQALGWEKYHFNSLRLCYYTRTGSNTPGSVILSPDYDAADSAPVNEQIASAYHGTQEDVAWKDNCLTFDPKLLSGQRFIRTGGLSANQDIKTYDIANAFVSTLDGTAVNWGKVWFEYDITLINQQLNSSGPSGSGVLVAGGSAESNLNIFGSAPVTTGSYNITALLDVVSMSGLSIGTEYLQTFTVTGTGLGSIINTANTGLTSKTVTFDSGGSGSTTSAFIQTFTATSTAATSTFTMSGTTVTSAQFVLTALQPTPSF